MPSLPDDPADDTVDVGTADGVAEHAPVSRWRRRVALIGIAVVLVLVGLLLTGRVTTPSSTSGAHGQAENFSLDSVREGEPRVELKSYRGTPVVLNFFAAWCVPCRTEMPGFEAVHQQLGDRVAFLGVDHNDSRPDAVDLLTKTGVTYPTGFNPQGNLALDYGLIGMPTTVFISTDGRILEEHTGALSQQELKADIARLFSIS